MFLMGLFVLAMAIGLAVLFVKVLWRVCNWVGKLFGSIFTIVLFIVGLAILFA